MLLIKHTYFILLFLFISTLILMPLDHTNWNGINYDTDKNIYKRFFDRLYYASTAIAGVGYGDITPSSYTAKAFAIFLHIMAIFGLLRIIRDYMKVL
jgi:hypothetical protein